jgi:penicillin-binding protein 1A
MRTSPAHRVKPGLVALALVATACSLPRLDDYHPRTLAQTTFVYASDGSLITELHATEDRVVLRKGEMTRDLRDAVVAIEDRRFWSHHGVDLQAILRAAYENVASGEVVEGGSTITQQLVKNLYTGDEQTFRRKIDEAILAWQMEDRYSKQQILTRYLNTVYFGEGAYGAQAAARTYFGVDARALTLAQSAMLAGLIASPNHFDPFVRMSSAVGRRGVVLGRMLQDGTIGRSEFRGAAHEAVILNRDAVEQRYPYPYFIDYFKRWFLADPAFGRTRDDRYRLLFTGGLRITTTLDPTVQRAAQDAVTSVLSYPGDPDAAVTVLDPRTGYVRAMVGGKPDLYWRDVRAGRVNLATGAGGTGRQTGSSFKPFALVAALENGVSPSTVFAAPSSIDIPEGDGTIWHVTNANGSGYGSMTLASATVNSVNTVYAQLIHQLGADTVVDVAQRMGMRCCSDVGGPTDDLLPLDAAVLGANEATTLEMASAYGTLATGGKHVDPVPVITVSDAQGNVIWQAEPQPEQAISPEIASAVDGILQDAVLYGTGDAANIGRPQIGKTGTDDDQDNAWFVGSVPQLTAAVWVGFHQGQIPMTPPRTRITVFGGTWPAQIWRLLMVNATQGLPEEAFPTPQVQYVSVAVDVTQQPYCLPNSFTLPLNVGVLEFVAGTEPTAVCTTPTSLESVIVPSVVGLTQDEATSILESAGFYVQTKAEDSTQPPGTAIYQAPTGGTNALQTSTVTLTIATEPASPGG